jgi:hypothetical protein
MFSQHPRAGAHTGPNALWTFLYCIDNQQQIICARNYSSILADSCKRIASKVIISKLQPSCLELLYPGSVGRQHLIILKTHDI